MCRRLPRPPLLRCLCLLVVGAAAWLGASVDGAGAPLFDDSPAPLGADLAGSVLDVLGRIGGILFGWLGLSIGRAVKSALRQIADAVALVVEQLARFAVGTWDVLTLIWRTLRSLLIGIFQNLLRFAREIFAWLRTFLNRLFRPILDFLIKFRDDVTRLYLRFVRPILNFLEELRFLLRILGALGVEFAKELDLKLRQLEQKLLAPLEFFRRQLNFIIDQVNRIITLDYFIQRILMRRSLFRDRSWWVGTWGAFSVRELTDEERARAAKELDPADPVALAADFRRFRVTGQGETSALIRELVADFRIFRREQS